MVFFGCSDKKFLPDRLAQTEGWAIDKQLHDRTMNRTIWKEERMRDMREQSDEKARQIEEKEDAELNTDKEMNYVSVDGQMIH